MTRRRARRLQDEADRRHDGRASGTGDRQPIGGGPMPADRLRSLFGSPEAQVHGNSGPGGPTR